MSEDIIAGVALTVFPGVLAEWKRSQQAEQGLDVVGLAIDESFKIAERFAAKVTERSGE